jgi:hypothetical protein
MPDLRFSFDWEDPRGAQGDELRATWARLSVQIGGEPVAEHFDRQARAVKDNVAGPLYPVAEWLATHWWHLFHETEPSAGDRLGSYSERHSFSRAGEGFALPHLTLSPMGRFVNARWESVEMTEAQVRFLRSGESLVEADSLRAEIARLIGAVLERLDTEGIADTYLHDEWAAIASADAEESAFCRAAAALGLDPFNVSSRRGKEIIATSEAVPDSLLDDYLAVAPLRQLRATTEKLKDTLGDLTGRTGSLPSLRRLRGKGRTIKSTAMPWEAGYAWARGLRQELGLNGTVFKSIADIAKPLKVSQTQLRDVVLEPVGLEFIDGLVSLNSQDSPCFIVEKRHDSSRLFTFCRALFDYVSAERLLPALVVDTHTEQQRRNRAFAAEFLAPAHLIRRKIRGTRVGIEEIQDIANDFGVSGFVVKHQIENHHLASVVGT